jgi:purine-binding chemotaxis protein CheW
MPNNRDEHNQIEKKSDFVTLSVDGQMFGIPVLQVQDVLNAVKITRVPLAPREIAGNLNLRGRIVTAIDVRQCLGMTPCVSTAKAMNIVVEQKSELYSLVVDRVGEVLSLADSAFEPNPPTLARHLRDVSRGIFQLNEKLLIILDITALLQSVHKEAA